MKPKDAENKNIIPCDVKWLTDVMADKTKNVV